MKYLKLAIGLVILSATAVFAFPSVFRGDRIQIGGSESLRSLTYSCDSLGANANNVLIFKTPRGMLFTRMASFSKSAFVGTNNADSMKATLTIKSGATTAVFKVDSGDVWQDYTLSSAVHFDSAVTCTLTIDDGNAGTAAGTGGVSTQAIFWWNDDYTNR